MACRLCLMDKKLRNSHIIPEFLYKGLYLIDDHRFKIIDRETSRDRIAQKGLREKLLCHDCEQFLDRRYEKYFKSVWYDDHPLLNEISGSFYEIIDLDYAKIKLFLLSVLWRAGVASLGPWSEVTLGPHENIIREMILSGDPGPEHKYSICAHVSVYPPESREVIPEYVQYPTTNRIGKHRVYQFVFGKCLWSFYVSSQRVQGTKEEPYMLFESGILRMPVLAIPENSPTAQVIRKMKEELIK